jgi:hypothetical protein
MVEEEVTADGTYSFGKRNPMPNHGEDIEQRDWLDDDCVLPFMVWVQKYSGLSEATCRRITQPGRGGPPLVRLSERRLGVRMGDHRAWLKLRQRPG